MVLLVSFLLVSVRCLDGKGKGLQREPSRWRSYRKSLSKHQSEASPCKTTLAERMGRWRCLAQLDWSNSYKALGSGEMKYQKICGTGTLPFQLGDRFLKGHNLLSSDSRRGHRVLLLSTYWMLRREMIVFSLPEVFSPTTQTDDKHALSE